MSRASRRRRPAKRQLGKMITRCQIVPPPVRQALASTASHTLSSAGCYSPARDHPHVGEADALPVA